MMFVGVGSSSGKSLIILVIASIPFVKGIGKKFAHDLLEKYSEEELVEILTLIMNSIQAGSFGSGGIYSLPADNPSIDTARKKLAKLTSTKYFMKK